jgi:hypothetical protein
MFSEALTIDELQAAREDLETNLRGPASQGSPACALAMRLHDRRVYHCLLTYATGPRLLDESASVASDQSCSTSSTISIDADQQMENIDGRRLGERQSVTEFLDAAVLAVRPQPRYGNVKQVPAEGHAHVGSPAVCLRMFSNRSPLQARSRDVQQAVIEALLRSPDAVAALERGLAHEGISFNIQRLQTRAALLPPAAAAVERCQHRGPQIEEIPNDEPGGLKEAFDRIKDEVLEKLSGFGGRVLHVLQGVIKRWKHRIEALLNPGVNLAVV